MFDGYFRRPIFWDYLIAVTTSGAITMLWRKKGIAYPKEEYLLSVVSDLSTTSLTLAGFILTLITVLISFKSTVKRKTESSLETESLYELFFFTKLYFDTIKHLKYAIVSLSLVAVTGYTLKMTLTTSTYHLLFSYNLFAIAVILFTLWRCLIILSKIIKIQQTK